MALKGRYSWDELEYIANIMKEEGHTALGVRVTVHRYRLEALELLLNGKAGEAKDRAKEARTYERVAETMERANPDDTD